VRFEVARGDQEAEAVAGSDLVILHSPIVRVAFEHFFAGAMGRVYANLISVADDVCYDGAPFLPLARPFAERDIDVIFVASNWRRPEKNYPLLRRIAASCGDLRVHVVGAMDPDDMAVQRHGIVAQRASVYGLLGRAKVLVCPSSWDPAPGVLFEASLMGCNVVASRNCGNWELCNERLLAQSPDEFVPCLRRALAGPLPDHRQRFLGGYAELVDTLQAFV
jgi:glycosyltransferase involved in cell wall biosynthesis